MARFHWLTTEAVTITPGAQIRRVSQILYKQAEKGTAWKQRIPTKITRHWFADTNTSLSASDNIALLPLSVAI